MKLKASSVRIIIGGSETRDTRFENLGYRCDGPKLWRIVDKQGGLVGGFHSAIGPQYKSKGELLADLERFAREVYGHE